MSNPSFNPAAWEIEQQIRRFAIRNDEHDHDGLAAMFTADGSFARPTDPENVISGRESIRAFFRDRPKRATLHFMSNTVVEFEGEQDATARSYIILMANGTSVAGEFRDRLRQENGEWLFVKRRGSLRA